MIFAGIDYSMSCPCICLHDGDQFSIDNCTFHFLTNTKKYIKSFYNGKITGHAFAEYDSDEERYHVISNFFMGQLDNVSKVAIEAYSFGSTGQVFNIGENTGLLKHKMFMFGIPFQKIAPSAVKKLGTGRGNAKKDIMYNSFVKETSLDLLKELDYNATTIGSPIGDIVDSFYICKSLLVQTALTKS